MNTYRPVFRKKEIMRQSPKLPAEKRRSQLIKAAQKVFARKGYAGATTEEIARAAGLTKGALYFHFKSKGDIFFAVIKEINENISEAMLSSFENEPDPEKGIKSLVQVGLDFVEKQKYYTVDFWPQAYRVKRIKNYLEAEHIKLTGAIADYLYRSSRLTRKDSKSLVGILHAVHDGVVVRHFGFKSRTDLKKLSKDIIEMARLYINNK
jgi:AcrR family transcriptional regulator